ncbi:MAG: hypothetical protein AB1553_13670 [Nitrospirota bacterium]
MPVVKKLPAAAAKKIKVVEDFGKDYRSKKSTPEQAKAAKKAAQETLGKLVKLTKTGTVANSIDRAIYQEIRKNEEKLKKEVMALMAKKEPEPADYYRIYIKILKDSGFSSALPSEIVDKFGPVAECDLCTACTACALCSACAATLTAALGATGAVAGHAAKAF